MCFLLRNTKSFAFKILVMPVARFQKISLVSLHTTAHFSLIWLFFLSFQSKMYYSLNQWYLHIPLFNQFHSITDHFSSFQPAFSSLLAEPFVYNRKECSHFIFTAERQIFEPTFLGSLASGKKLQPVTDYSVSEKTRVVSVLATGFSVFRLFITGQ